MLETLKIRNVAVIDQAEIPFERGLNILSGETGAGKSIVIEAISLLLGGRASADLIRAGTDEAVVEGVFNTKEIPWLTTRLTTFGFESASDELLIRRTVHRSGKHRIHVNGQLATVSVLQQLCEGLVDLCGQHEHQSLLKAAVQLDLVDRYGGLEEKAAKFSTAFGSWRALTVERDELAAAEAERTRRADFLGFQIQELEAANLEVGEDHRLGLEKQLLQSSESRVQLAESVRLALEDASDKTEGDSAIALLRGAANKLRQLGGLDDRAASIAESVGRALAEAEDAAIALGKYLASNDLDPARLSAVQERLALIAGFRRKYGATTDEMVGTLERLHAEATEIGEASNRIEGLGARIEALAVELLKDGKRLSQARRKVATAFAASVTGELKDLKMSDARFEIECAERGELAAWTASGMDLVQFVVQTNRGDDARPLGKIASGGELSRLMLAVRRVISDRGGIGVYLFDEIDAGIGGQTAFQVGKKLKSVAKHNQVICITHLPQVAAFADHHLSVQKTAQGKRTQTEVVELSGKARQEELARMLGGPALTKKSLENAVELLGLAK